MREQEEMRSECDDLRSECDNLRSRLAECYCYPVPPPHLRARVGGGSNPDKFLGIGRTIFGDIMILIEKADRDFSELKSVLDFGCGSGRVARYANNITGTDIDYEAVEWCRKNLPGTFDTNAPYPPLRYPDASFDLVYAISVFTHLPEGMERAWLEEIGRIIKPGGLLVTSVIGKPDLMSLAPSAEAKFDAAGFYFSDKHQTDGLPGFYELSFHSREYIESHWMNLFDLRVYQPQAINNHQTGIVLMKKD